MKFDLIISNPPYNQNLDLKILKNIYDLGDKICFVHPAGWAYSKKYNLSKIITDVKKIPLIFFEKIINPSLIFNITILSDVAITMFKKNEINIIESIDLHGDSQLYKSLKTKILNYSNNNNLYTIDKNKNYKKYQCGIAAIRGHKIKRYPTDNINGFYSFIQLTDENMHIGKDTKYPIKFFFNTIDECIIFKDYLKTKMARFCLSIFKINQNQDSGELASVPYMPTYEHPWTDEEVAAELGLTDEELAWAINWIPDYYPEDAEKYAKYIK